MGTIRTLTQDQVDRIVAVVEKDATGVGRLYREEGGYGTLGYCALGGLLSAAGVPDANLATRSMPAQVSFKGENGNVILKREYGLMAQHRLAVWSINDDHSDLPERRKALIKRVRGWRRKD